MTNRAGKIKDIDAVARGRIFSASQARDLGMVDRIASMTGSRSAEGRAGEPDQRPPAGTTSPEESNDRSDKIAPSSTHAPAMTSA